MPDLVLRGARFDRLVEGRVVASGEAQRLELQRDDGRFVLEGVSARVQPQPGSPTEERFGALTLTTPGLTGDAPQRGAKASATASQGARIVSEQGDTMSAQRMELDGPADLIRASGDVRCEGPQYRLLADAAEAPTEGHRVSFVRPRGQVNGGAR